MKRVFIIVLDSLGIGAMPDADEYGDANANTLLSISKNKKFNIPNLKKLGLFNIDGVANLAGEPEDEPVAKYLRLAEKSAGKETIIGHWEIAGVISKKPLPTYPNGFPKEVIDEFEKQTGVGTLCNKPYSGTQVILDYGKEHIQTGNLIVYTSADSVFQIAAHEKYFGLDRLYKACECAREILNGKYLAGRIIARPFDGEAPDFFRTPNRHDYSIPAPEDTLLDKLKDAGKDVIAIGKIADIFAMRGITFYEKTCSNADGMDKIYKTAKNEFNGLCFTNLVDFDMLYGHRNDVEGYANAVSQFDIWLKDFLNILTDEDLLILTSDHGCDPNGPHTDHTREYTFALIYNKNMPSQNLGTVNGFDYISKVVLEHLGV